MQRKYLKILCIIIHQNSTGFKRWAKYIEYNLYVSMISLLYCILKLLLISALLISMT